jgi:hypothetical protein
MSQINHTDVRSVAIGTTHFVNAVVEADPRRLSRVAVVRLCGPFTRAVGFSSHSVLRFLENQLLTRIIGKIPPFTDFPQRPREVMEGPIFYLDGGKGMNDSWVLCRT